MDARKLLDALTAAVSENTEKVRSGETDLTGLARDLLGQATRGVGTAARDIGESTGAGGKIDDLVRELSGGQGAGDLLDRAKTWAGDNKVAAGTILGGLGALLIGTRSGRSLATGAAKLGGLVLIGGLAYDAWKRHQARTGGAAPAGSVPAHRDDYDELRAPAGSGFEPEALSQADARRYLGAMIAAAMADGNADSAERAHIIAGLRQAGIDAPTVGALEGLFANPPTIADLTEGRPSPAEATRIYAAARLTIEPDTSAERTFLARLADALGLDPALALDIDREVASVRA
ncbi:MAG: DUF533 domain-containing protein [Rhizobiales bacterium]|nr:DUF533 domain-containing protein [Hyphomicrobiales bacterium]